MHRFTVAKISDAVISPFKLLALASKQSQMSGTSSTKSTKDLNFDSKVADLLKSRRNIPKTESKIVEGTIKSVVTTYDPEESEMFKGSKELKGYIELRRKLKEALEAKDQEKVQEEKEEEGKGVSEDLEGS